MISCQDFSAFFLRIASWKRSAQPGFTDCSARTSRSSPSATSRVTALPAPTIASRPIFTGATNALGAAVNNYRGNWFRVTNTSLTGRSYTAATGSLDPGRVLAVTFTRKAAGELRNRLSKLGLRNGVHTGTFHAIAYAQLRQRWEERGISPPELLDRKVGFVARLIPGRTDRTTPLDVVAEIEWAAARRITPEHYEAEAAYSNFGGVGRQASVRGSIGFLRVRNSIPVENNSICSALSASAGRPIRIAPSMSMPSPS